MIEAEFQYPFDMIKDLKISPAIMGPDDLIPYKEISFKFLLDVPQNLRSVNSNEVYEAELGKQIVAAMQQAYQKQRDAEEPTSPESLQKLADDTGCVMFCDKTLVRYEPRK